MLNYVVLMKKEPKSKKKYKIMNKRKQNKQN